MDPGEPQTAAWSAVDLALLDAFGHAFDEPVRLQSSPDPDRAARAARAIVQLAEQRQVLLFTCHPHVVELFRDEKRDVPVYEISDGAIDLRPARSTGTGYPKLIFASRLVLESALLRASSSEIRPSLNRAKSASSRAVASLPIGTLASSCLNSGVAWNSGGK